MSTVRFGIIGYGNMGRHHASYLTKGEVKNATLTAVCDEISGKTVNLPGVEGFDNLDAFWNSGAFDAVIIATPHPSHVKLGVEALRRGFHAVVEKPIGVHKKDAQKLIDAHTDKKLVLAAMFNQRPDPRFKKVRDLVTSGELGELRRVVWILTNWFRSEAYYASGGWRATWKGEGGGVLLNQSPHQLDLLQWMCGMPCRVRAFCHLGKYHHIEVEDDVTAYLEYPNGATGVFITTTGEAPGTNRLEITGDRGKLVVENGKITFWRTRTSVAAFSKAAKGGFDAPEVWEIAVPAEGESGQHKTILQNVVNAIRDGEELIAPGSDGIHSIELANAMLYSSWTNGTVELPLDGDAYEAALNERIANSTFVKTVREVVQTDMSKTF
ncbi:MAG: Gfo/Idh/MocA family oxidoreductase [Kiritimatiellia bacterium]